MKSNLFIILIIGVLIFLGVLWLYKNNKIREGIDPPDPETLKEFAKDANQRMANIGLTPPSMDQLNNMFDIIGGVVASEATAAEARAVARATADAITPAVNTVQPLLTPLTFFTGNKFGDAFCQMYGSNYTNLSNQCAALTSESCNATDCCVWVNGKKCMAGDKNGPTVPMGSSATIDADYYSYKYQCYGECNSPTIVPPSRTNPSLAISSDIISGGIVSDCMTDDTSTNVTPECVNLAWSQLGCNDTWKQIPMNKGWFKIPDSILGVDTTGKNLYYKDKSTHVADITGQTMALVQGHMAAMAQNNPNACVPQAEASNADIALSMLFG